MATEIAQGLLTALMFKFVLWLLPAKLMTHTLIQANALKATVGQR